MFVLEEKRKEKEGAADKVQGTKFKSFTFMASKVRKMVYVLDGNKSCLGYGYSYDG